MNEHAPLSPPPVAPEEDAYERGRADGITDAVEALRLAAEQGSWTCELLLAAADLVAMQERLFRQLRAERRRHA